MLSFLLYVDFRLQFCIIIVFTFTLQQYIVWYEGSFRAKDLKHDVVGVIDMFVVNYNNFNYVIII